LLKNGHLLRFPHPSSLQRTAEYASLLRISGALHLALFEQPGKDDFFRTLLELRMSRPTPWFTAKAAPTFPKQFDQDGVRVRRRGLLHRRKNGVLFLDI
jgi:hypothetical protein